MTSTSSSFDEPSPSMEAVKPESSSSAHTLDHQQSTSGWRFQARLRATRHAATTAFFLNHNTSPVAPSPDRTEWIDAIFGVKKQEKAIRLDFYNSQVESHRPPHGRGVEEVGEDGVAKKEAELRPGLIMFHGGGFVIGHGTDDAKFARAFTHHPAIQGVAVGVSYRMAPEYPFPIPVEDCASAITHLYRHAHEHSIDRNRLFLAGFSAGGNLSLAALNLLNSIDTSINSWNYVLPADVQVPKIRGVLSFYPLLDYSIPRKEKRKTTSKPNSTLPASLTTLFDTSYIPPGTDLLDPRLSPSRASDELVDRLPPIHLVVCEHDMLRHEGQVFRDRLKERAKSVTLRQVAGEAHAWDKPLPPWQKPSVKVEYDAALQTVEDILKDNDIDGGPEA